MLAAAHKTLVSKSRESLTTRTLHSELVYNYSGSKHVKLSFNQPPSFVTKFYAGRETILTFGIHSQITESLKRCGISESSTYVLAARFAASLDEVRLYDRIDVYN